MAATNKFTDLVADIRRAGWVPMVKPPALQDIDIPRIASQMRTGEDELHAVMDVEAPMGGYDSKGRLTILYEPHIAYALSSGATRDRLVAAGLAYAKWGTKPYPKDSYPRLTAAYDIAPSIALQACSIGRGQVLARNYVAAGFDSPEEMWYTLLVGGEAAHLEAVVSFIIHNHLDDEIRAHNWAAFARGYNGSGYKKNNYDVKLAARYKFWQSKPDTPWSPHTVVPAPSMVVTPEEVVGAVKVAVPGESVIVAPVPSEPDTTAVVVVAPPVSAEPAAGPAMPGTVAEPIRPTVSVAPRTIWQRLTDPIINLFLTR